MRARAAMVSAAIALAGLPVTSAAAQDGPPEGVDADSPTGAEYQVPLERARDNAAKGGGGSGSDRTGSGGDSSDRAPLFGAGVTPSGGSGGSGGGNGSGGSTGSGGSDSAGGPSRDGAARGGASSGGSADGAGGAGAEGGSATPARTASRIADDDGDLVTTGGVVGGVLLLAGGLGFALHRGLRGSESS